MLLTFQLNLYSVIEHILPTIGGYMSFGGFLPRGLTVRGPIVWGPKWRKNIHSDNNSDHHQKTQITPILNIYFAKLCISSNKSRCFTGQA